VQPAAVAAAHVREIHDQRPNVAVVRVAERRRDDFAGNFDNEPRPAVSIGSNTSASVITPETSRFSRTEWRTRWIAAMSARPAH